MCNLYNVSTNQDAIRALTKALDRIGNLPPSLDLYPDYLAPIVRNNNGGRELATVRWGMPSSQKALFSAASLRAGKLREKGKPVDFDHLLKHEPDRGTTNIRNTNSSHWKRRLGVENRCVVPDHSFRRARPRFEARRWRYAECLVRRRRERAADVLCGDLGFAVGERAESEGRADARRSVRLSDNRTQQRGRADPSQG